MAKLDSSTATLRLLYVTENRTTKSKMDWQEYQIMVAEFFREQGCDAEIEKPVQGARAKHIIDVYVSFKRHGIESVWIVECKLWKSRVPKEKILVLKGVVEDVGADRGIIICENGFQSGANSAAANTNITLITSIDDFRKTVGTGSDEVVLQLVRQTEDYSEYKFPFDARPQNIFASDGLLLSSNWNARNISVIDPIRKHVLHSIDLDLYEVPNPASGKRTLSRHMPGSVAIADDKVFVGQLFSDTIFVIDLETHAIIKRISLPGSNQGEIVATYDEKYVIFASNSLNCFYLINSADYSFETFQYPDGGRGCGALGVNNSDTQLYIGVQRGGNLDGISYFGGNTFLAIFDLKDKKYIATTYLSEIDLRRSASDNATSSCITYDEIRKCIYVGMFQSMRGIVVVSATDFTIIRDIRFTPKKTNKSFQWVDPLAQVLVRDHLFSINRNNAELVVICLSDNVVIRSVELDHQANGPSDLQLINRNTLVVGYPDRDALVFFEIDKLISDQNNIRPAD